jgi:hypothetical protein
MGINTQTDTDRLLDALLTPEEIVVRAIDSVPSSEVTPVRVAVEAVRRDREQITDLCDAFVKCANRMANAHEVASLTALQHDDAPASAEHARLASQLRVEAGAYYNVAARIRGGT